MNVIDLREPGTGSISQAPTRGELATDRVFRGAAFVSGALVVPMP